MGLTSFTGVVLKNLFSKPVTRMYPQKPREYPERTRGHVINHIEACIFCGICQRKCPTNAIEVDRTNKTWKIERFNCVQCACCVHNCPKKCLAMQKEYTKPEREKTEDMIRQLDSEK